MTAVDDRPALETQAIAAQAIDRAAVVPSIRRDADPEYSEFVEGVYVEKDMGWESEWIANRLVWLLMNFTEPRLLGWVNGSNAAYQCFEHLFPNDPDRSRKPDVSFVRRDRMTRETMPQSYCRMAPDLAVEVISPNDLYGEIDEKVDEYLRAGVRLVWVVNPQARVVHVRRADGSVSMLRGKETLSGEDVIPGFECSLTDIFQWPEDSAVS